MEGAQKGAKYLSIREDKDQYYGEWSLEVKELCEVRLWKAMEVCPLFWAGCYTSAVQQHGCEKRALGEDVKAGRVLKLCAVLSVAAQEEMEVLWWKVSVGS